MNKIMKYSRNNLFRSIKISFFSGFESFSKNKFNNLKENYLPKTRIDSKSQISTLELDIKKMVLNFNPQDFSQILTKMIDIHNSETDSPPLLVQFETVYMNNINMIDYITKAKSVLFLANKISRRSLKFNEDHWIIIFQDFNKLIFKMNFKDFFSFLCAFDIVKKNPQFFLSKYNKDFHFFYNFKCYQIINEGICKIETIEHVLLFSNLLELGIIKLNMISDGLLFQINQVISKMEDEKGVSILSPQKLIQLIFLLKSCFEIYGLTCTLILNQAIQIISKQFKFTVYNSEMCSEKDLHFLQTNSPDLFFYYLIFIHKLNSISENENLIEKLIFLYRNRLFSIVEGKFDFNFFLEMRIVLFLVKEYNYTKDAEFNKIICREIATFTKNKLTQSIYNIFAQEISYETEGMLNGDNQIQNISEMSLMFYLGLIIDLFTKLNMPNEYFESILLTVEKQFLFKEKHPFVILQFIFLHCKKLYKKKEYHDVWEKLLNLMHPREKDIISNTDCINKLIDINFADPTQETHIMAQLTYVINKIVFENKNDVSKNINEQFESSKYFLYEENGENTIISRILLIYSFIENRINLQDGSGIANNLLRVISYSIVDVLKFHFSKKENIYSGFDTLGGVDLQIFSFNCEKKNFGQFQNYVLERIMTCFSIINNKEENITILYVLRFLKIWGIVSKLQILQIKFKLEKLMNIKNISHELSTLASL
jgi:hypothetical protein